MLSYLGSETCKCFVIVKSNVVISELICILGFVWFSFLATNQANDAHIMISLFERNENSHWFWGFSLALYVFTYLVLLASWSWYWQLMPFSCMIYYLFLNYRLNFHCFRINSARNYNFPFSFILWRNLRLVWTLHTIQQLQCFLPLSAYPNDDCYGLPNG